MCHHQQQITALKLSRFNCLNWSFESKIKFSILLCFVIIIIVLLSTLNITQFFENLLTWEKEHPAQGAFLFILVYIVATVLLIPGSILTLGAGFIFRPLPTAIGVVLAGASIGLFFAFLFGRYLCRGWVSQKLVHHAKFLAVDKALENEGWKVLFLLRLAPVFPFNILNYIAALTKIKLWQYLVASVIGIIPGTCLYVYLGSLAGDIKDIAQGTTTNSKDVTITVAVISGVVIIAAVVTITVIAKRAIKKALDKAQQDLQDELLDSQRPSSSNLFHYNTTEVEARAGDASFNAIELDREMRQQMAMKSRTEDDVAAFPLLDTPAHSSLASKDMEL